MSILCLLFAEGLNCCAKDSPQEGFTMHQISRSHRRSVRWFRNTWLLLAQLCWLFLTEVPGQFTNSTFLCQLCGALTHLLWMLFWFSTGEASCPYSCLFLKARCGRYFPCLCDEECDEHLPPLLTPFRWDPPADCLGRLHFCNFHK